MPKGKTIEAGGDQRPGSLVLEAISPFPKRLGLLQIQHGALYFINYIRSIRQFAGRFADRPRQETAEHGHELANSPPRTTIHDMTPEELANKHPRLYHVTEPGGAQAILDHGLLTTAQLVDRSAVPEPRRSKLLSCKREKRELLEHPDFGQVVLNDNRPLHEGKLDACLDDDLTAADWLMMLNKKVFFWATKGGLNRLLKSSVNRNRPPDVIVVNTLSLASTHFDCLCISPINSGATLHKPARRGLSTFALAKDVTFASWSVSRGNKTPDKIREITVDGGVPDIRAHVVDVRWARQR